MNLTELLHLRGIAHRETAKASYHLPVPHIAPNAYLHTIFAGSDPQASQTQFETLRIPSRWQDFLLNQNGADLFASSLYLYGALPANRLMNRESEYVEAPFSLEELNSSAKLPAGGEWLLIGSYGYDGSQILLSRHTGRVQAHSRGRTSLLGEWPDPEIFLSGELARLSQLFDPSGRLLLNESYTVPNSNSDA